jgi:hypothetical protein
VQTPPRTTRGITWPCPSLATLSQTQIPGPDVLASSYTPAGQLPASLPSSTMMLSLQLEMTMVEYSYQGNGQKLQFRDFFFFNKELIVKNLCQHTIVLICMETCAYKLSHAHLRDTSVPQGICARVHVHLRIPVFTNIHAHSHTHVYTLELEPIPSTKD